MCVYIIYLSTKWHGKVHLQCDDPLFYFFKHAIQAIMQDEVDNILC